MWIKEHRTQLLLAGVSITAILATVFGLKNKEAIRTLWLSLKEEIEKGVKYSSRWFDTSSIEELQEVRKLVQQDYLNPKLDMDYRSQCWELLHRFDNLQDY